MAYILFGNDGRNYEAVNKEEVSKYLFGTVTDETIRAITSAYDHGDALFSTRNGRIYYIDMVFTGTDPNKSYYKPKGTPIGRPPKKSAVLNTSLLL